MKSAIYLGKENIEIQNRPMPELGNYDVLIKNTKQSLKSLLLEIKSQNLKSVNVFIHTLVLQLEIQNEQEQLVDFLNIKIPNAKKNYSLYNIDDSISDKVACLIEPFTVGCRAARRAQPKQGENFVVFGCGTIGLAMQIIH